MSAIEPGRRGTVRLMAALLTVAPWATARVLVLIPALALTEGIGLLFLVPLLQRAGVTSGSSPQSSALERAMAYLPRDLGMLLLVYVGVIALRALLEMAESHATAQVESQAMVYLRERMYRALVRARWDVLARLRGARIAHVLAQEFEHVGIATNQVMRGLLEFLVAGTYGFAAILIAPSLSSVAGGCALALLVVLRTQQRATRDAAAHLSALGEQIFAGATEHVAALKSAKAAGIGERLADHFTGTARSYAASWVRMQQRSQSAHATMSIGAAATLAVIVYLAVNRLHLAAAPLLVLLFVYARLVARLVSLQQTILLANRFVPALRNVERLLDELRASPEAPIGEVRTPIVLTRALTFENVCYQYPEASEPALGDVSCSIPAGLVTAVVGASGAGKSTLADVALLLLSPQSGRVLVDGVPIELADAANWRAAASYLPQDAQLFHDSVRENVRWFVPDAADDVIVDALRLAGASALLGRLARGLDTVVGDRGVLLSGGERQRIALARALLRRPRLLLLDEATSALDMESEREMQATLRGLTPDTTVVIVTHRLATARQADHVVVMDGGAVIAEGAWQDIVADPSSRLALLWDAQFAKSS